MKSKNNYLLVIMLLCCISFLNAQIDSRMWFSGGATYGGFVGDGLKGNTFDKNVGFKLEIGSKGKSGLGFMWYSFSTYKSTNHLNESTIDANFTHHVWELRYFFGKKKFQPYLSLGIGVGTMKFDGMEGNDRFMVVPYGAGAQYIFDPVLLEAYFKPFSASENQLEHNFGYETGILIGYIFK